MDGPVSITTRVRRVRLTSAQEALWLAEQMSPDTSLQHVYAAWRLAGTVNVPALQQALQEVVRHHPVMSVSIDVDNGEPFQVVQAGSDVPLEIIDCAGGENETPDDAIRETVMSTLQRTFDLTSGPLTRVTLVRCGAARYILCVAAHHIVWDGLSTDVFARELGSCYVSALDGTPIASEQTRASFLDVAATAGGGLNAVQAADLAWWKENLTPLPPALCLSRGHTVGAHGARAMTVSRVLSSELTAGIREISRAERVTPFMTMLAAFAAVLFRLTGQTDMTVAVPVSGRTDPDTERMIGLFVQTLPARVSVPRDEGFAGLMRRVRGVTLDAMAHQALPYPVLVREMAFDHREATDPLCQVAFQLRRRVQDNLVLPGMSVDRYDVGAPPSAYDLTMTVEDEGESMTILLSFDPTVVDVGTAQQLLKRYELLLTAALDTPDDRVGDLDVLEAGEEHLLLDEWGGRAKAGFVPRATVHALVEGCAGAHPDAVAVEEGADAMTYGELNAKADRLALLLRAHGVLPRSVVGLLMGRSAATVVAMLAILKAGASYLPLDPDYPSARLSAMIQATHPALVLAASKPREDIAQGITVMVMDTVLAETSSLSGEVEDAHTGPEDPAYIIFTSGSTGEPKGVVVPHRGVVQLVSDHGYWDGDESDCVAYLSTVAFDAATFEVWGALCRGARLVVVDRDTVLSPALLGLKFERYRVTTALFTTSLFNVLVREAPALLRRLRLVLFGGEMADPAAVRLLLASGPPTRLINAYGPAEATTIALWHEVRDVAPAAVTVSVGRPIAGATAYVVDTLGHLMPPGVPGELCIGGAGVALGYLGDEELTAARFVPDPWTTVPDSRLYRTGDSAVWREDGNLELRGRLDEQIKLRGFRIEPREIVAALERVDRVRQAVVIVREDRPGDRRLVSYLVSGDGKPLDVGAIAASLAAVLPSFMLPSAYVQMPSLPTTPVGKLDARSLPAPVPRVGPAGVTAPSNETERQLTEVWKRVLGLNRVGIDDNFFELGGHSLIAVRLVADVEHLMGIRIPMSTLFEAPTVRTLARLLSTEGWTPDWNCLVPVCTTGSLPPIFCPHGDQVSWLSRMSRELGMDQPLYALQPQGLDGRTEPLQSIESMAARYIAEIRNVVPHGPYYLLGYSLGGAVAFEMARQFEACGQRVAFLGLIDSAFPGVWDVWPVPLLVRLRLHVREIARRNPTDAVRYMGHRVESLWRRIAVDRVSRAVSARRVASASERAWTSYVPGAWTGRLTFFASTERGETIWEDSRGRWSTVVIGEMEVVPVDGTHGSVVNGANLVGLAESIRNSLCLARERFEVDARAE
jgi:amino acid adenylation domain-containing protein